MGKLHDITEALGIRRRRRVRFAEPAPALETRFLCAHSGCRELVRVPGMCKGCNLRLSLARVADVREAVRVRRGT